MTDTLVTRCGVRYRNARFVSHELVNYTNKTVRVEQDPHDPNLVQVFTTDGKRICLARRLGS